MSPLEPERASQELRYGVCDCEYPCSCVEFRGQRYGSWKEIIDALAAAYQEQKTRALEAERMLQRCHDSATKMALDLEEVRTRSDRLTRALEEIAEAVGYQGIGFPGAIAHFERIQEVARAALTDQPDTDSKGDTDG